MGLFQHQIALALALTTLSLGVSAPAMADPAEPRTALVGVTKPAGPYSPGVVVGRMVFLSGQVGADPTTNTLVAGGVKAETKQAMENLGKLLQEAGLDFSHVVKSTVFLADIQDFADMNSVYGSFFSGVGVPPARSTLQAGALPRGARVEIEFIAVK